ncbi:hypothetical protein ACQP1W_40060 [Spirillospora sp. CA-255316]
MNGKLISSIEGALACYKNGEIDPLEFGQRLDDLQYQVEGVSSEQEVALSNHINEIEIAIFTASAGDLSIRIEGIVVEMIRIIRGIDV